MAKKSSSQYGFSYLLGAGVFFLLLGYFIGSSSFGLSLQGKLLESDTAKMTRELSETPSASKNALLSLSSPLDTSFTLLQSELIDWKAKLRNIRSLPKNICIETCHDINNWANDHGLQFPIAQCLELCSEIP